MYADLRVAAVVPAYKEQDHIADVIRSMPDLVDLIVVVDDCSPDDTEARARSVHDDRLIVHRMDENRGVGGAIMTGHGIAVDKGADVCVVMAGDGQMDPDFLPDLLGALVESDAGYAKANRFFDLNSFDGMPRHRVFGNIVLSFFTKAASGYWNVFDPQNGYTAIRSSVLKRLPLQRIANRYSFENDLLINLNILRVRVVDVPIPARYGNEVSGMRLGRVAPEILWKLFRGFWRRMLHKYVLWSFSPIAMFLFGGIALSLFGFAVGVWVLVQTLGPPVASAGSVILSVAPLLIGVQMLMYALLLDIQESPDQPVVRAHLD